jgi:uncharacterized membrane protein YjjP (DUF1212 family)
LKDYNKKRDYDKNPIVVKDYNYVFLLCCYLVYSPCIIYILFFAHINGGPVFVGGTIGLYIVAIIANIKIFSKAFNKRKIVLSNNSIKFFHEDKILESINLDEITSINRTFSILYHKSQSVSDTIKFFQRLLSPVVFVLWFLPLITSKFFFIFS